jgi:hypothetical protein
MAKGFLIMKRIIITLIFMCTLVFCSSCSTEEDTKIKKNKPVLRFEEVEKFVFVEDRGYTSRATVYVDTKTGVKYLYLWSGAGNGGPAITRLWDN